MDEDLKDRFRVLYQDYLDLAKYLMAAQGELAELCPTELKAKRLPDALLQMDAVVQATEQATNTIMTAAEEIMAADPTDGEAFKAYVNDACMRIFEACSFQDITGQRITKVLKTLQVVEQQIGKLQNAWGSEFGPAPKPAERELPPKAADGALLNGPALVGQAITQEQIDAMLAG
jgi:chemotaxis regulatin CheY-phosphate phosphatase CheZ